MLGKLAGRYVGIEWGDLFSSFDPFHPKVETLSGSFYFHREEQVGNKANDQGGLGLHGEIIAEIDRVW